MTEKNFVYNSILGNLIDGYIKEKRAIGYSYNKEASSFRRFDKLVVKEDLTELKLTNKIVLLWIEKTPNETESNRVRRISLVRGFAEYMVRLGYDAYIYPSVSASIDRYFYVPYIFSESEIKKIFQVCDNYPISEHSPNRHLILQLVLRMLYGCGLRISEALNLTFADINLTEGTLYIKNTKFKKERIVPMSQSLTMRCQSHMELLKIKIPNNNFLFPSPYGGRYNESTIYKLFRGIMWDAGISHTGKGPRLHDLRHTFCVHCLKRWVLNGYDLTNCLPYLSAYVGHVDLRGTQHYLRLTADLYPDITSKVEQSFSSLIPEVIFDETE